MWLRVAQSKDAKFNMLHNKASFTSFFLLALVCFLQLVFSQSPTPNKEGNERAAAATIPVLQANTTVNGTLDKVYNHFQLYLAVKCVNQKSLLGSYISSLLEFLHCSGLKVVLLQEKCQDSIPENKLY